jgi:hypothetical protein
MRRRVIVDIEFTVDEGAFKSARLVHDAAGVSDPTDDAVRDVVAGVVIQQDWSAQGLTPLRSTVTARALNAAGDYDDVVLAGDRGLELF